MIKNKFERISLYSIDNTVKDKIKLIDRNWTELKLDKKLIYKPIVDAMLNYNNMIHLLTSKKLKKMNHDQSGIFENVSKYIVSETEIRELLDILNEIGIGNDLQINSYTTQGDIGEYIMNLFFLQLFETENIDLIVPKLIFKTATKMPVFGDDNIYFDVKNNILYLGEAKFYNELNQALLEAQKSIDKHLANLNNFAFLKKNTNIFKYNSFASYEQMLSKIDEENLFNKSTKVRSIVFLIEADTYLKKDIEKKISKYPNFNGYVIVLPILNKNDFLEYYKEKVSKLYGKK